MTSDLAAILEELGVRTISAHGYRGAMQTAAVASMERILARYGRDHLKMVLLSIVETSANNRRELTATTIWAIADIARAHPHWVARASDWFAAIDKCDLASLRAFAKRNRVAVKPRHGMASVLFGFLHSQLEPQGDLL